MNEALPNEAVTLAEIQERFDAEWILVEASEFDASDNLIRGKVLWHSKDCDEVYREDLELRLRSAAYLYTGPAPESILVNL